MTIWNLQVWLYLEMGPLQIKLVKKRWYWCRVVPKFSYWGPYKKRRASLMAAGIESACNVGDWGLIPGLGRSPGEGNGYPLQYSGLENSMDYSMGSQRVRHDWATFTFTIRREVASTEPEGRKLCEDRGREWSDAAISQGMSEATRSCQKWRTLS